MRKKFGKRLFAGLMIGMLSLGLSACGASSDNGTTAANYGYKSAGLQSSYAQDAAAEEVFYDMDMMENGYEVSEPVVNAVGGTGNSVVSTAYGQTGQKLIRTKTINAETTEFDAALNVINAKVSELSGYIQSSSVSGTGKGYNMRSVNMTIRIPGENMDLFVQSVEGNVSILSSTESARDVTLSYVDMESHVKALRTEQEALMTLLQKAEELDDIIRIQSQLTQVRYEIESYESSLRTLDNQVNYSTVELTIREVVEETPILENRTFGEEVLNGLSRNLHGIGRWFRDMALWFLTSLPYLVIWAVVITVMVVIVRKIIKKRKAGKIVKESFDEKKNGENE